MNAPGLVELILHGREERYLEYKSSMSWRSSQTKAKIAKTAMAMANIPDGGSIVFGVEEDGNSFQPQGMADGDFISFSQDGVTAWVNERADPYVEVTVSPVEFNDGKKFVVVQVREFDQLPVICKKGGQELRSGAVYTRSRRMYETVAVSSQTEMREILDAAVDKEIRRLRLRGLLSTESAAAERHRQAFEEELGGL